MPQYTNVKLNISEGQTDKIKTAIESSSPVSIRLHHEDLRGEDVMALAQGQVNKVARAHENGMGLSIKLSKTQVAHNLKVQGGFLSILAGLSSQSLPILAKTLGIGALTGLASTGVEKAFGSSIGSSIDDGLYLKKGGCMCQIESDGNGLLLSPAGGSHVGRTMGDGLYLRSVKSMV